MVAEDAEEETHGRRRCLFAALPLADGDAGDAKGGSKCRLGHAQGDTQGGDGVVAVFGDVGSAGGAHVGILSHRSRFARKKHKKYTKVLDFYGNFVYNRLAVKA